MRSWGTGGTWQEACPGALRRPGVLDEAAGYPGAPGSRHSAPSLGARQVAPDCRGACSLPPSGLRPMQAAGKGKAGIVCSDVTSGRVSCDLFSPSGPARDLGLSRHQPERPPCCAPLLKPAVLGNRPVHSTTAKGRRKGWRELEALQGHGFAKVTH